MIQPQVGNVFNPGLERTGSTLPLSEARNRYSFQRFSKHGIYFVLDEPLLQIGVLLRLFWQMNITQPLSHSLEFVATFPNELRPSATS
jgi:hypothetical protein